MSISTEVLEKPCEVPDMVPDMMPDSLATDVGRFEEPLININITVNTTLTQATDLPLLAKFSF
jgi:hypothetical protein